MVRNSMREKEEKSTYAPTTSWFDEIFTLVITRLRRVLGGKEKDAIETQISGCRLRGIIIGGCRARQR